MRKILIILFIFGATIGSVFAEDTYLFILGKSDKQQLRSGDIENFMQWKNSLQTLINEVDPKAVGEFVYSDKIDKEFYFQFDRHLEKNNRKLAGIIFLGHGNKSSIHLSNIGALKHRDLLESFKRIFESYPISDNFKIYLGSCMTACEVKDQRNLLNKLSIGLKRMKSDKKPKFVQVMGHPFLTNSANTQNILNSKLFLAIYKSGVSEYFETIITKLGDLPILKKLSGAYSGLFITALPAVLGSLSTMAGYGTGYTYIGGVVLSAVIYLVASVPSKILRINNVSNKGVYRGRGILYDIFRHSFRKKSDNGNCALLIHNLLFQYK